MFLLRGLIRLCGLWPAFRWVVLLVAVSVCCLGSFISFFFFLVGCSGVINVFSVFGVALSVQGGSCVLCFLLQGGLGPASVVYCFVRLRWSHQTLKLS